MKILVCMKPMEKIVYMAMIDITKHKITNAKQHNGAKIAASLMIFPTFLLQCTLRWMGWKELMVWAVFITLYRFRQSTAKQFAL